MGNMPARSSTPTEERPALAVKDLGKTFRGRVKALDRVSFRIGAGRLVGVIGSNGSGKTTLMRILFGILAPDEGEAHVLGLCPHRDAPALRAQTGFAGQGAPLDPEMSGWETLRLFYALRGLPARRRRARLDALCETYELRGFARRRIRTFSGGERQRLHLALEMMHEPRLLLLDEPTSNLDAEGRRDLWNRLTQWRDEGRTILVATHDLDAAAAHCDRLLLLGSGALLADGAPRLLLGAYSFARTVVTIAECVDRPRALREELSDLPDVRAVIFDCHTVTLLRKRHPGPEEPALEVITNLGYTVRGYERRDPDLADAYQRLADAFASVSCLSRRRRP